MSNSASSSAPYQHSRRSVAGMMRDVLLALLPLTVALTWLHGAGVVLPLPAGVPCAVVFDGELVA